MTELIFKIFKGVIMTENIEESTYGPLHILFLICIHLLRDLLLCLRMGTVVLKCNAIYSPGGVSKKVFHRQFFQAHFGKWTTGKGCRYTCRMDQEQE